MFEKDTLGIRKRMGFARTSLALVNLWFGKMDEGEGGVNEEYLIPD